MCGECLTDSFVQWGSFVTRRSRPAAVWASQSHSISAWARSFIPSQGYSVLGLLLENNCDSNETPLQRSRAIYMFSVKNSGSRKLPCAAGWGNAGGGDTPTTTSWVLGRVQVRVGGMDPMLVRMLGTEFLSWSKFTHFGWDSLNRMWVDECQHKTSSVIKQVIN